MSYSYDRSAQARSGKTANGRGPAWDLLHKRWNDLHDLEYVLDTVSREYDRAASYMGGPGRTEAQKVMTAVYECKKVLSKLVDGDGAFDKLQEAESSFVKKHGLPDDYVREQQDRMGLR